MQIEHVDKENDTVILKLTINEAKALACIMGGHPIVPATARELREKCFKKVKNSKNVKNDIEGYSEEALDTPVLDNYDMFCNAGKEFSRRYPGDKF